MTTDALVTIIVPVYNAEASLHACVDSIIDQLHANTQIILVDDGSTDSSPLICDVYAEQQSNIECIHKPNGGLSSARNRAIAAAKGKYILFVDSDDRIERTTVSDNVQIMEDCNVDLVIFGYYYDVIENNELKLSRKHSYQEMLIDRKDEIIKHSILMKSNTLIDPAWNKLYRTDVIRSHNIEMPINELFEDTEFIFRLLHHVDRIYVNDQCYYHYFQTDAARITNTYNPMKMDFLRKRVLTMNSLVERMNPVDESIRSMSSFWIVRYAFSSIMDLLRIPLPADQRHAIVADIINDDTSKSIVAQITRIQGFKNKLLLAIYKTKNVGLILLTTRVMARVKYNMKALFVRIR